MFDGFERRRWSTSEVEIAGAVGGSGPPVLLLHGYPQTHAMWHRVAPSLARAHTVVATDLRGYGDSGKPPGDERHERYSKRAMAGDQVEVMAALGFDRFAVVGHDRGGRVAHRLALDHPDRVERLAVLDIVPTHHVFANVDKELALAYYHWFFLAQPPDLPERLVGADPRAFLHRTLGAWGTGRSAFAPEALIEYERAFDADTVHASCEDYRAGATIDLEHDEADRGRVVDAPLLVLWGERTFVHRAYDVLAVWRAYAGDVRGQPLASGHFLAEERPHETASALAAFLGPGS